MKFLKLDYTKEEWAWMLQDWANSVYSLMIVTAIFPLFFKDVATNAGISSVNSTAYLGYANSISTLIVSILAPVLGALADYKGMRNPMFTIGTLMGVLSVWGMIFLNEDQWLILLVFYTISGIGYSASNIFYDSSIMDVTTFKRMDKVSSLGYGLGYIGSTIPFIIFMAIMFYSGLDSTLIVKIGFFMTGLWWFIFTIPYWKHVKQTTYREHEGVLIVESFKRLFTTLQKIGQHKQVFLFLIAYFFYIDGVGTIFKMATAIGSDIGISDSMLIGILLMVQFVAFPFSIIYGRISKRIGNKKTLFLGIFTYILICVMALTVQTMDKFIILTILVGTAQGGIQALSRSMFGQIIPEEQSNEFFGFYNVFGKFSSILGTTLVGLTAQYTGNSLDGVFSLIFLFLIGAFLLYFVKVEPKGQEI
ncbi:MFS transporter, UMF1 family [Granulicatella balaenopterae]|uniref:MFS transporter, UMF1 family n=1 Tax=Granulicatella balaenopterae TaxID=137733 RepID=A0A1H9LLU9_9LACT|nr:MFS transporter [Granulicatella balaenopterae]SER12404.1 MFS transporter, UMF1 family [Granulicatella balaenopterae]